jgi:hypothetical protein
VINYKEHMAGLTQKEWEQTLERIAAALRNPTRLTLMGSAPNILGGQPSRTSIDLDVWKPASTFDRQDLEDATEKAGLLFNPKGEIEPNTPYIQIVEPGICQLGEFRPEEIETVGNLRTERPPAENLIAAKLVRAEEKDLEDIAWLLATYQPEYENIRKIIQSFPREQRARATENLVFLEVLAPKRKKRRSPEAEEPPFH